IYIGKAILDLTKYHMYDFYYNVFSKQYPDGKLGYMDTDSFILEVPDSPEGLTKFLLDNRQHFDLSECENKELPLYWELENKKAEIRENRWKELEEDDKYYEFKSVRSDMTN